MERKKKVVSIGSLPEGDRRGASGADAGRYSMQAIGGEGNGRPSAGEPEQCESNRRYNLRSLTRSRSTSAGPARRSTTSKHDEGVTRLASIEELSLCSRTDGVENSQETQSSPLSSPSSLFSSLPSSPPSYFNLETDHSSLSPLSSSTLDLAVPLTDFKTQPAKPVFRRNTRSSSRAVAPTEDVSQEAPATQPATTKAGKLRSRMKWDDDINTFIMRTYLYVTKLETDKTMYCKKLFDKFKLKYPTLHVSSQRIADQRRVIVRNKLLSDRKISSLRLEVSELLRSEEELSDISEALSTPGLGIHTEMNSEVIEDDTVTAVSPLILSTTRPTQLQETSQSTQTPTPDDELSTETNSSSQHTVVINVVVQELIDQLQSTLKLYSDIDAASRPKLPRLRENRKLYELVHVFNYEILGRFFSKESNLVDVHTLIYCSAVVISTQLGYKIFTDTSQRPKRSINKPPWQIRLENDIKSLRADIGRVTQYINNNRHVNLVRKVNLIFEKNKIHSNHEENNVRPAEFLDTLKQKLTLKSQRLARYNKALQRKLDNKEFTFNEKGFYRSLKSNPSNNSVSDIPTENELKEYWKNIWKKEQDHNEQAGWIKVEEIKAETIEEMEFTEIDKLDIELVTRRMKNWKAAGIDGVHNFWYKKFFILHSILAKTISDVVKGTEEIPNFATKGITYMLPKSNNTADPSQYRPITCLPTLYKLITSCITCKINHHLDTNNILAEEQKGCRQGHRGCKEQLIIDSTILKHATSHNRNLHLTYIDYKKAFDSVPHSWLIRVLQIYKINPDIITFLEGAMSNWRTTLLLSNNNSFVTTDEIPISNGIFQGDSLSPLWFCLALNPLSSLLNNSNYGYKLTSSTAISHLMYMDDIKLFAKSEKEMRTLIETTAQFSKDINMSFGLDKCKTLNLRKGKVEGTVIGNEQNSYFTLMEENDTYKYLGLQEGRSINHTQIKKDLNSEYFHRVHQICKKKLFSKNLFKALNTYAIPILTYSFGIVKWSATDIKKLEIKTRSTLTKYNFLHPKSAIERMSIERLKGGRGLIDLKNLWEGQIKNLRGFFYEKSISSKIHLATIHSDNKYTPLNLVDKNCKFLTTNENTTAKFAKWRNKELHGRHVHDLEQPHVDMQASNKWLKFGSLFPETEGFIIAIQDQVINTSNYRKFIIKDPTVQNDKCRKCHRLPETIQHITSACPSLTQTDYTHRHNQVVNIIHQKLALKHKLIQGNVVPYYQYSPKPVLENSNHRMYFDRAILTDKTIHNNRPDITLIDKIYKIAYIIDIAVPNTHNLQKTITEKIHKYTELKEEIIRIWKLNKVYIVPLVLSSTGVIPKCIQQYLKVIDIPENTYITMQKAAILNTCRIVRKFLQDDTNYDSHLA